MPVKPFSRAREGLRLYWNPDDFLAVDVKPSRRNRLGTRNDVEDRMIDAIDATVGGAPCENRECDNLVFSKGKKPIRFCSPHCRNVENGKAYWELHGAELSRKRRVARMELPSR